MAFELAQAQDDVFQRKSRPKAKISIDKVDSDGKRTVSSKFKLFAKPSDPAYISWAVGQVKDGDTSYTMLSARIISKTKLEVEKGMLILIKTNKGCTMTLECCLDNEDLLTDMQGYYEIIVNYHITKAQIEQIRAEGLKKVRIETEFANFDKEYKDSSAGDYIVECYDLVTSTMNKQKSFSDGF